MFITLRKHRLEFEAVKIQLVESYVILANLFSNPIPMLHFLSLLLTALMNVVPDPLEVLLFLLNSAPTVSLSL